ncbi:UDP binding domain-containing protein [Georgenia sp. MJ173]|uniref:UDP binding domain-containing protein n=1 Tax=Georgenia sunbinii TaxID=3117728 RepID=UPI002F26DACF
MGFGGGCLPKDIRAFMARAGELGVDQALTFLREVDSINDRRRDHVFNLATRALGGNVAGKRVAVLGATFKPATDDLCDSPALDIAAPLTGAGADVVITDPQAGPILRRTRPDMTVAETATEAITGAQLTLLLTEWTDFRELDPAAIAALPADATIIDGRNALDPQQWRDAGWTYHSIGRP